MFTVWNNARRGMNGLRGLGALQLSLNSFTQYTGQPPTYTITGAQPNADIYWSSLKNGESTGEVRSFYGHKTDGNGNWSATTGPWPPGLEGNWWKTAHVGDESSTVQFQILAAQPVSSGVSSPPVTPVTGMVPLPAPWNTQAYQYPNYYAPPQRSVAPVEPNDSISILGLEVPRLVVYGVAALAAWKFFGSGSGRR
jgi:hypothetical protein